MSGQELENFPFNDFSTLENFDRVLKVLTFYHTERCDHEDCSQCFFTLSLRCIYTEHIVQKKQGVQELINYCKLRKKQFICARLFISRLANLERERIKLEKSFNETFKLWNNYGTTQRRKCRSPPSPTESSSITKEEFIKEIEITV